MGKCDKIIRGKISDWGWTIDGHKWIEIKSGDEVIGIFVYACFGNDHLKVDGKERVGYNAIVEICSKNEPNGVFVFDECDAE